MEILIAPQPSRAGELMRRAVRRTSPLLIHLAGRRVFTIWALLHYRGRRSGREYATPIAIGVTPAAFLIPLPFAGAQWYLNVIAAGECVIRWNGHDERATEPEVVDRDEAAKAFGPIARRLVPMVGIDRFLRLRRA
jgi:deazaflavin-dependent oxidoreductase (nitroreductase family)